MSARPDMDPLEQDFWEADEQLTEDEEQQFRRSQRQLERLIQVDALQEKLPSYPEFWLALTALAEEGFGGLSEAQQARVAEADLVVPGLSSSAELRPFVHFVRETLRKIASLQGQESPVGPPMIFLQYCLPMHLVWPDKNGDLHLEEYEPALVRVYQKFLEFLKRLDSMLRECPICSKLYWAKRKDQKACQAHANTLRVRNWDKKPENKEKVKRRRKSTKKE
ncbi:MAG: hypothetical protein ACLQU2_26070 [Candidatus Binataceae bacterium]